MMRFKFIIVILLISINYYNLRACTIFNLSDSSNIIVGKSNAWGLKDGYIMINTRNTSKKGFILGVDNPIKWISKFGSLTFNQISQEMPNGGINEKGLVVEILSSWAKYPAKDERKAINESQWIQYQLDNFETVEQVINSEQYLRINRAASDMHYFISDRYGNKASIDLINGKFKVHQNKELVTPVLTNMPYADLICQTDTKLNEPKRRFLIAKKIIEGEEQINVSLAWRIINRCKQTNNNYNVVYDLKNLSLSFNDPVNNGIKTISLKELNFDCGHTKVIPIQLSGSGNVNDSFTVYSQEMNTLQLNKVFQQLVNDGRIKGIKKVLTKMFYINKLNRIIIKQTCSNQ